MTTTEPQADVSEALMPNGSMDQIIVREAVLTVMHQHNDWPAPHMASAELMDLAEAAGRAAVQAYIARRTPPATTVQGEQLKAALMRWQDEWIANQGKHWGDKIDWGTAFDITRRFAELTTVQADVAGVDRETIARLGFLLSLGAQDVPVNRGVLSNLLDAAEAPATLQAEVERLRAAQQLKCSDVEYHLGYETALNDVIATLAA
jgi:hypothetical protein